MDDDPPLATGSGPVGDDRLDHRPPPPTLVETLHERAIAGDSTALGALFDLCRQPLWTSVLRRVHNHHAAEDICQDVYLKATLSIASSAGRPFTAWLLRIGINRAVDWGRRNGRVVFEWLPEDLPGSGQGPIVNRLEAVTWISRALGVDVELDREDWILQLWTAFGKLNDDQRVLLSTHYLDDQSHKQIAERIGVELTTVNMRLYHARQRLLRLLHEGVSPPRTRSPAR